MSRFSHCLVILVFAVIASLAKAEAPFVFETTPGRLPKDVVPIEYALHVVPDIASRTYQGSQTIRIEVLHATSKIVMNALNIEIDSATLEGHDLARIGLDAPQVDKDRQTLAFTLRKTLAPGRYALDMTWRGVINSTPEGLYIDRYHTPAGEKLLLATMMEPTGARRLLPCWDEPAFRARFRLSVDLPGGYAAYSNMPIVKSGPLAGGSQRVAFGTTPKMASYLLALVAGDMERLTGASDGTQIGIVATAGKQGSAHYALDATKQLLHYYNDYFGTRYPLPKLDQIAMPGGFRGAMENWGAIVYNETRLLVDPAKQPRADPAARICVCSSRNGTPMVWQSCDHGLVGQLVAQRKLCPMDGIQGQRPIQSAVAFVVAGQRTAGIGDGSRRTRQHASDPAIHR